MIADKDCGANRLRSRLKAAAAYRSLVVLLSGLGTRLPSLMGR